VSSLVRLKPKIVSSTFVNTTHIHTYVNEGRRKTIDKINDLGFVSFIRNKTIMEKEEVTRSTIVTTSPTCRTQRSEITTTIFSSLEIIFF
jgi:hypothetical protein